MPTTWSRRGLRWDTADLLRFWQHAGPTSAAEPVAMISAARMQLGERSLICCGASDFTHILLSTTLRLWAR
jgi:hypothetical protein